jgi:hypothetical protein
LRLSRIDLNAEVDGISVDYFRRSLRIPGKRKSGEVANADLWTNRGVETFYVGRSPSRLRVYDKCQELKYRGVNVEAFPRTLTRIEWEYRHDHCPVKMFSDLPLLRECEAFRGLQLLECPEYYDFRAEPRGSLRRYTYNRLTSEYGAQDGARIFNHDRHFWRSFKPFMVDNEELKQRIQDSYTYTTNLFFENRGADVRFVYGAA